MGFIKAFTGAIGGTLADQWKDYFVPMPGQMLDVDQTLVVHKTSSLMVLKS